MYHRMREKSVKNPFQLKPIEEVAQVVGKDGIAFRVFYAGTSHALSTSTATD